MPHGTYARKFPDGARVRRFLCPRAGRTVSLLPSCLAAHWSGELVEVERAVREAGRCKSRQAAADRLRQDYVGLVGAVRWLRRRVVAVEAFLTALRTSCPDSCGLLEPTLEAFEARHGGEPLLARLRVLAGPTLASLPAPVGFRRQWNRAGQRAPAHAPHAQGLDPPPAGA